MSELTRKCSSCCFSQVTSDDLTKYICKFNPPQLLVVPAPGGVGIQPMFPIVECDQWCGQFVDAKNGKPGLTVV